MEKKNYIKPEASVVSVEAQTLLAGSEPVDANSIGVGDMESDDWSGGDDRDAASASSLWEGE